MKRGIYILVSGFLFLASPFSLAIVDEDGSGVSDVFELQHNNGQPLDPAADPDGDGWTNAAEFAASTNPFDANAPNGYVRPSVNDTITTSSGPDGNGGTVISTLHTIQVAWPTKPGVKYTLLYSTDLTPESWQPVPLAGSTIGTGTVIEFNFPLTNPTKTFWRVKMDEVDTDSDGVNNAEEHALGLDPNEAQTVPGFADLWVAQNFLADLMNGGSGAFDPNADSVGDGASDGDEASGGTDPNTPDPATTHTWVRVKGDGPMGVAVTKTGTLTIPAGKSCLLVIAIASEEFPVFTSTTSQFDDILTWNVQPSTGTQIQGTVHVNDRHQAWLADVQKGTYLLGFPKPVHIEDTRILTAPEGADLTIQVEVSAKNVSDGAFPSHVGVGFVPIESAPDVLAVNSDFDEGRIDPTTGYAIPDCDDANIALEAVRDHLNGRFANNDRVTDDLHQGFFGVNPSILGDDFWAGATVTIKKIDKTDPATGFPESGHIRLYGKWGNGPSEYRAIIPYDFDTLAATNLASGGINGVSTESVYGAASPFPEKTSYFIEGVHPGKITLEWRYQKGDIDYKYEQSFEVCTHKNATAWKTDLAYNIRLETSNDPSGQVYVSSIMLPNDTYKNRMERASEYYDFYQDCFLTPMRSKPLHSQAMSWPGVARLAGSQVIAGLSDAEYARMLLDSGLGNVVLPSWATDEFLNWSLSETTDLQQALFTGARTIFQSIGWQMHAYRSSGYRALDWVEVTTGEAEVSALSGVWKRLRIGILEHDKASLDLVALDITRREQNVTIVPTWAVISGLYLGTGSWMFTIFGENSCTPVGLDFTDVFPIVYITVPGLGTVPIPTGNLADTSDRWYWIDPSTSDGILDTWNKLPPTNRTSLVSSTLEQDARRFSRISFFTFALPTPVPGLPVWVWDDEDVK